MMPDDADDRDLRQLPTAHAVAVRLRRRGADDAAVAAALGVDVDAVPALLQIAEEKLAAIAAARRERRP